MHQTVSDYQVEILRSKRTLLKASLGSGKTTFATQVLPKLGRVLFITSRKVIKNQTIHSAIESVCKGMLTIYHQWDIKGKDINPADYDYIVIDEIHLLLSDTFSDGAFHVERLIKSIPDDKCLIMMSACADRVWNYLESVLKIKVNFIDLTGKTIEVKPKAKSIITSTQAYKLIESADENNKVLYFVETTKGAYKLECRLLAKSKRVIAITSKQKNRIEETLTEKEQQTLAYLDYRQRFPDDIDIIITTSKLREGLNLIDTRVKMVISELKDYVSLVQCSGRVRHGVENYYIVKDKGNRIPFYNLDKLATVESYIIELNKMISVITEEGILRKKILDNLQEMTNDYDALIIFWNGKFHINNGMVAEIKARFEEYSKAQNDLEQYFRDTVVSEDWQVKFNSLVEPYLNRRFSPAERHKLVDTLNQYGWNIKSLGPVVKQYGYKLTPAANYSAYTLAR